MPYQHDVSTWQTQSSAAQPFESSMQNSTQKPSQPVLSPNDSVSPPAMIVTHPMHGSSESWKESFGRSNMRTKRWTNDDSSTLYSSLATNQAQDKRMSDPVAMNNIISLQKNEPHDFTDPYARNAFGWPANNHSSILATTDLQPQSTFVPGVQNLDGAWRQQKRMNPRNSMMSDNLPVHTSSSSSMLPSLSAAGGIYPSSFLQQSSPSVSPNHRRSSIPIHSYPHVRMPFLGQPTQDDTAISDSFITTRQSLHHDYNHKPAALNFSHPSMMNSHDHQRRTSIETPTVSRFQSLALQSPFHTSPMNSPNLQSYPNASISSPISHAPVGQSTHVGHPMSSSGHESSPYGNDEQQRLFSNWSPTTPSTTIAAAPEKYSSYYSSGKKLRTNSSDDILLRDTSTVFPSSTSQYTSPSLPRPEGIRAISISADSPSQDDNETPSNRSSRKRSCDGQVYDRQRTTEQQSFLPPTHIVSPEAIMKAQAEEYPETNNRLSFSSYFDKRLSNNSNDYDMSETPFIRRRKSIALGMPVHEHQDPNDTAPSFTIPSFSENAQTRSPSPVILSEPDEMPAPRESVSAPLANRKFSASGKANHSLVSVVSNTGAAEADALSKLDDVNFNQPSPLPPAQKVPASQKERLKRPPNAYLLFNRDTRHKLLESMPHLTVAEISKEIGERWKTLSSDKRDYYMREASLLKKKHLVNHPNFIYTRRSKAELAEAGRQSRAHRKAQENDQSGLGLNGDPPRDPRGRKKKRHKNPTAPKHPMSGFLFYLSAVRPKIAQQYPGSTVGPISKLIAQQWRDMDPADREPWNQKADDDKKRYASEMREYAKTVEAQQAALKEKSGPPSPSDLDSLTIATVAQMVKLDREGDEQSEKSPTTSERLGPHQMHVPVSPEYSAMEEDIEDDDSSIVDSLESDQLEMKPQVSASAPLPIKSSNIR